MPSSRPFLVITSIAASLGLALAVPAPSAGAKVPPGQLPARAVAQIEALAQAKIARSAVDRKIASALLTELRQRSGRVPASGVRKIRTGVQVDKRGRAQVDIAGTASAHLAAAVVASGGIVAAPNTKSDGSMRAQLPLAALRQLAARPEVSSISPAAEAITAGSVNRKVPLPRPKGAGKVAEKPVSAPVDLSRATAEIEPFAGSVGSEGDVTHAADVARSTFQVSGVGAKVCVLSDGVNSLAASQARGDLPPDIDVLPGQAGAGDEGTAMLEIVHDLAPKAPLGFATATSGVEIFAQNIRDLRSSGCAIIVDDVLYFNESPFQDGPIARAVIDVTEDGALYFSSAGNQGNLNDTTSGAWEGDFIDSGQVIGKVAGQAHDFDSGTAVQARNPLSVGSAGVPVTLFWADPLSAANNDYDLYLLNSAGNVVAFSNNYQTGTQDPYELAFAPATGGPFSVAVVKFSGEARFLSLNALDGRFRSTANLAAFSTSGMTRGHSTVPAAFSVAAVPAEDPLPIRIDPSDPPNPRGPFPGTYSAAQPSEVFTSDGPRRVFFAPDGAPLTPGNFTSTGGALRAKPDITAADGVTTSLAGFNPFFGTSAAAPHAAAIAALVLSGNPGITPDEVRAALTGTAIDIETTGLDRDTGAGIVMADAVLTATGATPQPLVVTGEPAVVPTTGDGDAFLEPGEEGTLTLPLTNVGDGVAIGVSAALTSTVPGATVIPSSTSYGAIAPGATVTRDFTLRLAPTYELGRPVVISVRVTFAGYLSPTRETITIQTGQPSSEVVSFAYTGPAVAIPDNNAAGVDAPLAVSGVGRASRVTFSIDGTTCSTAIGSTTVGVDHTFVGDLLADLVAPDGTRVALMARNGGSGNNLCQAVFDDSASRSITAAVAANAPYTGAWRPVQPLSALAGTAADGAWRLHVADVAGLDNGSVRAFSVHLSGYVADVIGGR